MTEKAKCIFGFIGYQSLTLMEDYSQTLLPLTKTLVEADPKEGEVDKPSLGLIQVSPVSSGRCVVPRAMLGSPPGWTHSAVKATLLPLNVETKWVLGHTKKISCFRFAGGDKNFSREGGILFLVIQRF